jgi:hypothetical protein
MISTIAPVTCPAERPSARTLGAWWLVAMLTLLVAGLAGCGSDDTGGPEQPTFSFVIPAGAGDDIENGKPLDILPRELIAQLNETIQIVNNDDQAHFLGPWFVGPGETLRQRFTEAGVFEGACTVHPSGEFTVVVEA